MENTTKVSDTKSTKLDKFKYIIFILSFYVYLSGALYFYSYMNSMGFKGASLESIFLPLTFSQEFFSHLSLKLIIEDAFNLMLLPLTNSLIATSLMLLLAFIIKLNNLNKIDFNLSFIGNNKLDKSTIKKKPFKFAFITFPVFYLGQGLSYIMFIFLTVFIVVPLYIPHVYGKIAAQEFITKDNGIICKKIDDNNNYKIGDIILSCDRVIIDDLKKPLLGKIIHSDSNFLYVVTNHLLLRIKDKQIVSCIKKQRFDEKSKLPEEEEYKTCDFSEKE